MASTDFTVADVLAWARTKPADEGYSYGSISSCALCQFLDHSGIPFFTVGGSHWNPSLGVSVPIEHGLRLALRESDWTFGGLVARLEKLCPQTPVTKSDWLQIDAYLTDIEQVSA